MAATQQELQQQARDAAMRRLVQETTARIPAGTPLQREQMLTLANAIGDATASILLYLSGGGGSTNASDLTSGTVALARGGTGSDLSATGGTGHVLRQSSSGAAVTVGALSAADVGAATSAHGHSGSDITSGTIDTARLPADVVKTSGSYADPDWLTSLAATKLSGTINTARLPADVVKTSGSYADPSWVTSLAGSKLTGALAAVSGAALTGLTDRIFLDGTRTIKSSMDTVPWSGYLSATDYPSGRSITFSVVAVVTRVGLTGTATLYCVDDAAVAATVSFTSDTIAVQTDTVTLTGNKLYELQLALTGYSAEPDAVQFYVSELVVT